jgi:large subunit ribosomal protein L31
MGAAGEAPRAHRRRAAAFAGGNDLTGSALRGIMPFRPTGRLRSRQHTGSHPQKGTVSMKKDIHPTYEEATVHCSCGNTFTTRSTKKELHVELCSQCHPFYTGKQKLVDSGGRVDRFKKRLEKKAEPTAKAAPAKDEAPKVVEAKVEEPQAEAAQV